MAEAMLRDKDALNKKGTSGPHQEPVSFRGIGLDGSLASLCTFFGLIEPTLLQKQLIKLMLQKKNILACGPTSSGKTVGVLLPLINELTKRPVSFYALIVVPSYELAYQIGKSINSYGRYFQNIRTAVITGGENEMAQTAAIGNRPHVIVGTPGRLYKILTSPALSLNAEESPFLNNIQMLVLDEADCLLSGRLRFAVKQLVDLLRTTDQGRQTVMLTSTPGKELDKAIASIPYYVKVNGYSNNKKISNDIRHIVTVVSNRLMLGALLFALNSVLWREAAAYALKNGRLGFIFVRRRSDAVWLHGILKTIDRIFVYTLHSGLTERERIRALDEFSRVAATFGTLPADEGTDSEGEGFALRKRRRQDKELRPIHAMITTDVCGRGLDMRDVDFVINYGLPESADEYVNRAGRMARQVGRKGMALTITPLQHLETMEKIRSELDLQVTQLKMRSKILAQVMATNAWARANAEARILRNAERRPIPGLEG